jgi:hypothetical protein
VIPFNFNAFPTRFTTTHHPVIGRGISPEAETFGLILPLNQSFASNIDQNMRKK